MATFLIIMATVVVDAFFQMHKPHSKCLRQHLDTQFNITVKVMLWNDMWYIPD